MAVRAGYRQSEVGVIPEDWRIAPLGELLRRAPGYGINAAAVPFDSRYPTYIRITDISDEGRFARGTMVSVHHPDTDNYLLEPGDIVFARTGASVGKSYMYDPGDGALVFAGFLIRISPDPARLLPRLLSQYARSRPYWTWIRTNSMRSGQPGVNGREYARLPVPLPPTVAEQEAIAEALSDADALIESLKRLISKNRQIKQGAMQELLTGSIRLPGFTGEWEETSLDSVTDRITGFWGAASASSDHPVGANVVRAGDISQDGVLTGTALRFLSDSEFGRAQCRLDDIVITTSGNGLGKVWWCDGRPDTAASNFVRILRPTLGKSVGRYLAYAIRSKMGLRQLHEHTATSAYPNLRPSFFAADWISLPLISEQAVIASILSDMDTEIGALEAKLAKARYIKQGMMQELLTGRIRLV